MTISIGVLTYTTINMGDWTQTSASLYVWWTYFNKPGTFYKFLEKCISTSYIESYPITWIDRDTISTARKPEGIDKVILICNGWWLNLKNNIYQFPPHTWITPIYTSIHFWNPIIVNNTVIQHLKQFQPIGCRDIDTMNMLKRHSIDAYFSGCLTMVFNLNDTQLGFKNTIDYSNTIIYNDISNRFQLDSNFTHVFTTQNHTDLENKYNIILNVQTLINAMSAVKVYTSRLHVWLPLVCSNTNVELINKRTNSKFKIGDHDVSIINRFSGLVDVVYDGTKLEDFKTKLLDSTLKKLGDFFRASKY